MSDRITALATTWREQAEQYAADGALVNASVILRRVADELEREYARQQIEPLNIQEAAEESGYSASRLYELVECGKIANAGQKNAPRIRRCDLPKRPGPSNGKVGIVDDDLLETRAAGGRR